MPTLEEIDNLLDDPVKALQKRRRKKQRTAPVDLPPEEENSLLANLGQGAMSGLSFVGGQLDKFTGSRALRGLLGGKPRELASLLPFSDSLGITRPEDITSGNDLLGNPKDTSLFSPEGAAGFGVEVLLDPTLPFTGFLKGGLTAAGKGLKAAGGLADVTRALGRKAGAAGKFMGKRQAAMHTLREGLDALDPALRQATEAKMATYLAKKGGKIDDLLDTPMGGNLGYGIPFMDTMGVIGKKGGVGEKIAQGLDWAGNKLATGKIPGTNYSPGEHLGSLFDPEVGGWMRSAFQAGSRHARPKEAELLNALNEPVYRSIDQTIKDPHFNPKDMLDEAEMIPDAYTGAPNTRPQYGHLLDPIQDINDATYGRVQKKGGVGEALADKETNRFASRRGAVEMEFESGDHRALSLKNIHRGSRTLEDIILPEPAILRAKDPAAIKAALKTNFPATLPHHTDELLDELANKIHSYKKTQAEKGIDLPALVAKGKEVPRFWQDTQNAYLTANKSLARKNTHAETVLEGLTDEIFGAAKSGVVPKKTKTLTEILEAGKLHPTIPGSFDHGAIPELARRLRRPGFNPLTAGWTATQKQVESAYKSWAKAFGDTPMDARIYDEVKRVTERLDKLRQPEELNQLVTGFDSFMSMFKAGVLTHPAFHVRNLLSAKVQDFLNGEFSLWSNKMADDIVKGKPVDALQFQFVQDILQKNNLPLDQANANRVLRSHIATTDLAHFNTSPLAQIPATAGRAPRTLADTAGDVPGNIPQGIRSAMGEWKQGDWNLLGVRGVFGKESTSLKPLKVNEGIGKYIQSLTHLPSYLNQLARGVEPAVAARKTLDMQVDYSRKSFTNLENAHLKRVFPFYSFTRRMSEHVAGKLLDAPSGRLAQAVRGQARTRDNEQFVPEHIAQGSAIPIPGSPEGSQRFITSLGLMHEDPFNLIRPGQTADKAVGGTLQELAGRLNPLFKAPLELAAGKQLYSGRDLQDLEGNIGRTAANITGRKEAYDTPMLMEQALSNSPLSRFASTARMFSDPRKGLGTKASQFLSGVKVSDVDMEKEQSVAVRKALTDLLRGKTGIKQSMPKLYSKEEDLPNLSEEDRMALELYKRLTSQASKRASDAKKKKPKKKKPSKELKELVQ